jgi:hypothetical protein
MDSKIPASRGLAPYQNSSAAEKDNGFVLGILVKVRFPAVVLI